MTSEKGFKIELSSNFDGWWRYNTSLMCGCFDAEDRRTGFASAGSHIADVGSNLGEMPAGTDPHRTTQLTTEPCDHLMLYVYIVPHTLPLSSDIDSAKPFEVALRISFAGKLLRTEKLQINQWSGASVEMRVGSCE